MWYELRDRVGPFGVVREARNDARVAVTDHAGIAEHCERLRAPRRIQGRTAHAGVRSAATWARTCANVSLSCAPDTPYFPSKT